MKYSEKPIAVMQPYFLPYLGYFQLIHAVSTFVLFDDVTFIKKGWINRNRILTLQGEHMFSIPMLKASQNKLICDHKIFDISSFAEHFTKLIESNYKSAPYYNQGIEIVRKILDNLSSDLTDTCHHSIDVICQALDLECQIIRSSDLDNDKTLKAENKVADIVQLLNGKTYVNLPSGREIYHADYFQSKGLTLKFIQPKEPEPYSQIIPGFIPNLSIIDLLMSASANKIKAWITHYDICD